MFYCSVLILLKFGSSKTWENASEFLREAEGQLQGARYLTDFWREAVHSTAESAASVRGFHFGRVMHCINFLNQSFAVDTEIHESNSLYSKQGL